MSASKPPPLIRRRQHEACPVCGETSYSATGVHPQCAVRQADAKRLERLKREKKSKKAAKPATEVKSWQKRCPKCRAIQHVRKQVCTCGHTFVDRARPPTGESDLS